MSEHKRAVIEAAEAFEQASTAWSEASARDWEGSAPPSAYAEALVDYTTARMNLEAAVRAKREAEGRG